jgi:DNA-binding response OmpR family regulator
VSGATILVVDDEPDILLMVRMVLELNGFRVREATTGEQALSEIGAEPPDAVLLDIGLPRMDGWEVIEALREAGTFPLGRVAIFTAHVNPDSPRRAHGIGVGAYVAKPFHAEDLVASLTGLVRERTTTPSDR